MLKKRGKVRRRNTEPTMPRSPDLAERDAERADRERDRAERSRERTEARSRDS